MTQELWLGMTQLGHCVRAVFVRSINVFGMLFLPYERCVLDGLLCRSPGLDPVGLRHVATNGG